MSAAQESGGAVQGDAIVLPPPDNPDLSPTVSDPEDGGFDVDAARREAIELLNGETPEEEAADEETTKPDPKPKPKEEPAEEGEDEHAKKLRDELTEKDGKLSQDKLERAFASLTKQEKRLKNKVTAFKAERDTFSAERERVTTLQQQLELEDKMRAERRAKAKTKPLEALTELGWSYEDLVKYVMQDGKVPPEKLIKDMESEQRRMIEESRAELEAVKNDVVKHRTIAAGTDYERRLRASVADALPSFTYLPAYPASEVQDLVLQIQVHRYESNQKLPADRQESLDSMEILKELEQRQADIVERHAKRLGLKPGQAGAQSANPGTVKSKPLTNDVTGERGRKPPSDDAPFDRDAAFEEAMRQLHQQ